MDKYNNQNHIEIPKEKKLFEIAAEKWSEGNILLKEVLIKSRDIKMETYFSCGGHKDKQTGPHIAYTLTDESYDFIKKILLYNENIYKLGFLEDKKNAKHIIFIETKYEYRESFFKSILDILNQTKKEKIRVKNNINNKYILLLDFVYKLHKKGMFSNIDTKLIRNKDKIDLYLFVHDESALEKIPKMNLKQEYIKKDSFKSMNKIINVFIALFTKENISFEELNEIYNFILK